jgi:transposase
MSYRISSQASLSDLAALFALPSMLALESIVLDDQTITVHVAATTATAPCPRCGTAGARIHSRYQRTIRDLVCAGRVLVFHLRVRKWICALSTCAQRIFAERFPDLVQPYGRMTKRLNDILHTIGVTTTGADAARVLTAFRVPTTAKTVIRRVLRLPLPAEGLITAVGIDEWAWKKGHRYGTVLVDLDQHRVAALLPERSRDSASAWLGRHPEIAIVSRDRSTLFREAAQASVPRAIHVADRFHLQKNFGEALELFLRHQTLHLHQAAAQLAAPSPPEASDLAAQPDQQVAVHARVWALARAAIPTEQIAEQCGISVRTVSRLLAQTTLPRRGRPPRRPPSQRYRRRQMYHQQVWKLHRAGHTKAEIAQLVGISSRSVYRLLELNTVPPPSPRSRSRSAIDPHLPYLSDRWNQGCRNATLLHTELRERGYAGSVRTVMRHMHAFRPHRRHLVTPQTTTMAKAPSARQTACMLVRPATKRTTEQRRFLAQLRAIDPTINQVMTLAETFGTLLREQGGVEWLAAWQAEVRASGIAALVKFVDGLDADATAVANACSLPWSNGVVEGFVNKIKAIKRSSYGQAGFALLQRRVLLHPGSCSITQDGGNTMGADRHAMLASTTQEQSHSAA